MAESVDITITPSGPYLVRGPIALHDLEGNQIDLQGKSVVALCRCGASTTKPFCDGTHSKIGFLAANEAVRESS
jgi:CDGSH-type Zn-finger protein